MTREKQIEYFKGCLMATGREGVEDLLDFIEELGFYDAPASGGNHCCKDGGLLYEANRKDIWVGFNNRHYDQYIMKGILLGMNPKKINDWIIVDNKEGWQYSRAFNKLPMINYDVMPSNDETMKTVGLKTMEGFLGSNIKETDVDFRIKRKLTQEEIEQTVKYCRHDVEQTVKVWKNCKG